MKCNGSGKGLPELVGPAAFGIKMGVILPGIPVDEMIIERMSELNGEGLVDNGDILCITESVVARSQNNFITLDMVAQEVGEKLGLHKDGSLGVVFPILSRNRFSPILRGLSRAVNSGKVTVQLSFPTDEVGNPILDDEILKELGKGREDTITMADLQGFDYKHPLTGVNYIEFYQELITGEGAEAEIILSNDPFEILKYEPQGLIAADIHTCESTLSSLREKFSNCISLKDLCCKGEKCSEWGLLGSNLSSGDKLKLLPKDGDNFVERLRKDIENATGKQIHVMIYGDGAYKDPESGIYELADPKTTFGATNGLTDRYRDGIKYKFVADSLSEEGKSAEDIERAMERVKKKGGERDCMETEGTTPRQLTDILASLADLVSGSSDAGTPVVLVKNFF